VRRKRPLILRSRPLTVVLTVQSASARRGLLKVGSACFPCALGHGGCRVRKREGDGATPVGIWRLREVFYRHDHVRRPRTGLRVRAIATSLGWCDAPADRNYNRAVRHPYSQSAECLWRQDDLYDLVIVLGYNDCPRIRGRGSAIFMHVASAGLTPTAGCIALKREHLLRLLARIKHHARVRVLR